MTLSLQIFSSVYTQFYFTFTTVTQTQHKRYRTHCIRDMHQMICFCLCTLYALCVRCINIYCTNNKVINSTAIHIITMTIRHSPCSQDARPRTILLVYNVSKCVDILFGAFGNNSLRSSKDWRAFIRKNR